MELESFELVLLRRPANATAYDEATLERIQGEQPRLPRVPSRVGAYRHQRAGDEPARRATSWPHVLPDRIAGKGA